MNKYLIVEAVGGCEYPLLYLSTYKVVHYIYKKYLAFIKVSNPI